MVSFYFSEFGFGLVWFLVVFGGDGVRALGLFLFCFLLFPYGVPDYPANTRLYRWGPFPAANILKVSMIKALMSLYPEIFYCNKMTTKENYPSLQRGQNSLRSHGNFKQAQIFSVQWSKPLERFCDFDPLQKSGVSFLFLNFSPAILQRVFNT